MAVRRQSSFTCTPTIPGCIFTTFKLPLFTICASMCLAATTWKFSVAQQVGKNQKHAMCISFASLEIRVFICAATKVWCSHRERSLWPAICEVTKSTGGKSSSSSIVLQPEPEEGQQERITGTIWVALLSFFFHFSESLPQWIWHQGHPEGIVPYKTDMTGNML